MVGGFARINYFFVHDGCRDSEFRMLVNLGIIDTACVDVQLARNSSPVRGRARGGVRGGVRGGARGGVRGRGRGAGPTTESAVLFRMLPGAETVVVDVDAVVALMGVHVVYCGQDGYLVRRDSYFRHISE